MGLNLVSLTVFFLTKPLTDSPLIIDENAVNLVYGLISLHDNYDLEGFDLKRQNALNALIASCPRKAAP